MKVPSNEAYVGLCGNNNGQQRDDWLMISGSLATSADQLFDSWKDPHNQCQVTLRSFDDLLINLNFHVIFLCFREKSVKLMF